MQLFKNNAYSTLAAGLLVGGTTLVVAAGHGDRFPVVSGADFCLVTLQDASNNIEIVKVTARTAGADSMTVQRAQEGTTARAWNIGDVAELRLTAFALNPLSLLEGSATAASIRAILDVPTRAGGDASGSWAISVTGSSASCTGNSSTATTLQTARNINGTSFNGSADITTANWGTARTLTIGSTGKSVNGSAGVSWSLAEIGAFPAGGGSMPGALAVGGSAAPAVTLDVQTTGANALTSAWTTGLTDLNFRLGAMNGVTGGTAGTSQGKLGLFYLGTGETATIDFRRGSTSTDGSIAFRTSGSDRATLDNSGNFGITGTYTGNGSGLTSLNASNLASGTVPDARLNVLGIGQTWQNVTGSRALNTTYTNSTSKPIMVCISWNSTSGQAIITVDGVSVFSSSTTGTFIDLSTFVVPPGSTYSASGGNGIGRWTELR